MKALKIIVIIIIALAAIIIIGGFFLPKSYSVSRSTEINATDSVIYSNITDFKKFNQWNTWAKMEEGVVYNYTGEPNTVGHSYSWAGDKMGKGEMTILALEPYKMIDLNLHFVEPMDSEANTKFMIEPAGSGNKVTWTMSGDNNIIGKWMCVFISMDEMIGKDFESGLKSLKETSEAQMQMQ